MNNNIYDNSTSDNGFNFCNDSYSYDCDESNELCFDNDYGKKALPMSYMELPYRMDRLEKMLYSMCKKNKKHKKGKKDKKKRYNANGKQYKKRLKALEKQNADMMQCFAAMIQQSQAPDNYGWLKRSFERSAPHMVDLVSNVVASKRQPLSKTLNQPLCLPDKSSMK